MKKLRVASIIQWLTMLLWAAVLIPAYLLYSPYYLDSLYVLTGGGLLLGLLITSGMVAWLWQAKGNQWSPYVGKSWRGWQLYAALLVVQVVLFAWYVVEYQPLRGPSNIGPSVLSMLGQTLWQHGFLLGVVTMAWATGHWVGRLVFRETPAWPLTIALGWSIQIPALFGLAALGHFSAWWPWLTLVLLAVPGYASIIPLFRQIIWQPQPAVRMSVWGWPLLLVLLLFAAANLTGINRPIPVGFDAINFYLNIPHLLATGGTLLEGGQPYGWSLIMATAFAGFEAPAMALSLSVLPGILAILLTFRIARRYLPVAFSLLAAALVYTLPVITWQSTQEAKVDMALLFFLLVVVDRVLSAGKQDWRHWAVVGWLLGTAFAIKFTALFVAMGIAVFIAHVYAGIRGMLLMLGIVFSGVFLLGIYRFAPIGLQLSGSLAVAAILLIAGIAAFVWKKSPQTPNGRRLISSLVIVGGTALLAFLPWLTKNAVESDSLSVRTLLTGKPLYPEIPPLKQLDRNDPLSLQIWLAGHPVLAQRGSMPLDLSQGERLSTDMYEEVARYMGYEPVLPRYMTLPYDVTMRRNVSNYAVDIGYWLLLLFPLMLIGGKSTSWPWTLAGSLLSLLWLSVGVFGAGPLPESAGGLNMALPIHQLLFEIGSLFAGLWSYAWAAKSTVAFPVTAALALGVAWLSVKQKAMQSSSALWMLTGVSGLAWWWLGSGIPWYGLVGFSLAAVALLILVHQWQTEQPWPARVLLGLLGFWLLLVTVQRLQSPDPLNKSNQSLYNPLFAQYLAGELSAREVESQVTNQWAPTLAVINSEESGKVLRFGTFINYYIVYNNRRVILDNQLNTFIQLYDFVEGDPERLYDLLETLDIRYIVMSLKVGDDTDEQLLAQKAQRLMGFIRYHFEKLQPGIRLIHTDQDPVAGKEGTYASYELLFYE